MPSNTGAILACFSLPLASPPPAPGSLPPPLRAASLAFALTSAGKGGHGRGGEERRPGEGGGCAGAGERAEEGRLRQDGDAHHGQAEGELLNRAVFCGGFSLLFPPVCAGKKGAGWVFAG